MTERRAENGPRLDAGSFRDREGRIFLLEGEDETVYRALSATALHSFRRLSRKKLWQNLQREGRVVETREVEPGELPPGVLQGLPGAPAGGWAAALCHERIPFLSYPYEWSFGMLRDAALLQLELVRRALKAGFLLKDASAYNVQWRGPRPVFIDVASFEAWTKGDPWAGYSQFCQLFLYPLLLAAYRDLPFQPWLRGRLDGIEPAEIDAIFRSWRDRLRPGVLKDVWLLAKLQARTQDSDERTRDEMRKAGFKKEMILANVERLERIVRGLQPKAGASQWSGYAGDNSYDAESRRLKESFVERAAVSAAERGGGKVGLAWDLGANTGHYSRLVASHAELVVSMDGDPHAVDRLYRHTRSEGPENLLPLVMDLVDASPAQGWRHAERKALEERSRPGLVLALALVHHMSIRGHVPIPELVDWLAEIVRPGGTLVVEFVTKKDPMVEKLLRNQKDIYDDYDQDIFEAALGRCFEVSRSEELIEGRRHIYEVIRV